LASNSLKALKVWLIFLDAFEFKLDLHRPSIFLTGEVFDDDGEITLRIEELLPDGYK